MDNDWNIVQKGKHIPLSKLSKVEKKKISQGIPVDLTDKTKKSKQDNVKLGSNSNPSTAAPKWDQKRDIESIDFANALKTQPMNVKKDAKKPNGSSLQSSISELTMSELDDVIKRLQSRLPGMQVTWLIEIGAFLNTRFTVDLEKNDPDLRKEIHDFPLNLLAKQCKQLIIENIHSLNKTDITNYIQTIVPRIISDVGKGQVTMGHRIVIQLVLFNSPRVVITSSKMFGQLLSDNRSQPARFLTLCWILQQVIPSSFSISCRVLIDLLMPFISSKTCGDAVVQYAELLNELTQSSKSNEQGFTFRDFISIFDLLYPTHSAGNVPSIFLDRLRRIYPSLFFARGLRLLSTQNIRQCFPSLLLRLNAKCSKQIRQQVLACLVECLALSSESITEWYELFITQKALEATDILLQHLLESKDKEFSRIDLYALEETLVKIIKWSDDIPVGEDAREGGDLPSNRKQLSTKAKILLDSCRVSQKLYPRKSKVLKKNTSFCGGLFSWMFFIVKMLFIIGFLSGLSVVTFAWFSQKYPNSLPLWMPKWNQKWTTNAQVQFATLLDSKWVHEVTVYWNKHGQPIVIRSYDYCIETGPIVMDWTASKLQSTIDFVEKSVHKFDYGSVSKVVVDSRDYLVESAGSLWSKWFPQK